MLGQLMEQEIREQPGVLSASAKRYETELQGAFSGKSFMSETPPLQAHSRLQLFLQLVQEPPVGAFRDDLLGLRLDHTHLVQA